tara:strand:- start:4715 stop:5158 length:444 start_codon:yes stop_codon:yes gene_type:complete
MIDLQHLFDTTHFGSFKVPSVEGRAKISATHKGKVSPPQQRAAVSAAMKGVPKSAEHRAKLSAALKGHVVSAEHRAKLSAARKGRPRKITAEHAANIRRSKCKPMMTPHGLFPSRKAVSEAAGVLPVTVTRWLEKYPNDFYYVTKGE